MKINDRQRRILQVCFFLVITMVIFPPFVTQLPNGARSSNGFGFLFWPPQGEWSLKPTVDAIQLIAQLAAVGLLGGLAFVLSSDRAAGPGSLNSGARNGHALLVMATKLSGPLLRIIRGILVVWLAFTALAIVTSILQITAMDPATSAQVDWGKFLALMLAKFVGVGALWLINKAIETVVNRIYRIHYGRTTNVITKWRDF